MSLSRGDYPAFATARLQQRPAFYSKDESSIRRSMILVAVQPLSEIRLIAFLSRSQRETRPRFSASPLSFLIESLSSSARYPCHFPSPIAPSDCQGQAIPPSRLGKVLSAPFSLSRRVVRVGKYKVDRFSSPLFAAPPATLVTHKSELAARSSITRPSLVPARGRIREIGRWTLC
jgi:hypothetical protein